MSAHPAALAHGARAVPRGADAEAGGAAGLAAAVARRTGGSADVPYAAPVWVRRPDGKVCSIFVCVNADDSKLIFAPETFSSAGTKVATRSAGSSWWRRWRFC